MTQIGNRNRLLENYSMKSKESGGETGIRTLGSREGSTVFETAPIDHSGTSPCFGERRGAGIRRSKAAAQGGVCRFLAELVALIAVCLDFFRPQPHCLDRNKLQPR